MRRIIPRQEGGGVRTPDARSAYGGRAFGVGGRREDAPLLFPLSSFLSRLRAEGRSLQAINWCG